MTKKLSQLTPAGSLADDDLLLISQDSTTAPKSRKVTLAQVRGTPKIFLSEEQVAVGQFHTLKFLGSAVTVTQESVGVALISVAESVGGPSSHIWDASILGKPADVAADNLVNGTTVARFVAPISMSIPAGWEGSRAFAETPATTTGMLYILKNGSSIGSITFSAGQQVGVFASVPAATGFTLVPGDRLTLGIGGTQDATLASIGVSLLLYK